jgi:pSer/pThr/pTyr-binding forkhead associated (FHA) protein
MAVVFVLSRKDRPEEKQAFPMKEKLILGKSVYCDIKLDDRLISNIQCEIKTTKSGHVIAQNMDLKREVLLNNGSRLKKSALKVHDVLIIGPYELYIDQSKLTSEEIAVINSEYEEMV